MVYWRSVIADNLKQIDAFVYFKLAYDDLDFCLIVPSAT